LGGLEAEARDGVVHAAPEDPSVRDGLKEALAGRLLGRFALRAFPILALVAAIARARRGHQDDADEKSEDPAYAVGAHVTLLVRTGSFDHIPSEPSRGTERFGVRERPDEVSASRPRRLGGDLDALIV
jgi:hypothetical protein